jgi:hypothetical protein
MSSQIIGPGGNQGMLGPGGDQRGNLGPSGTQNMLGPGGDQRGNLGPSGTQNMLGPGGNQRNNLGPGGTQNPGNMLGPGGTQNPVDEGAYIINQLLGSSQVKAGLAAAWISAICLFVVLILALVYMAKVTMRGRK